MILTVLDYRLYFTKGCCKMQLFSHSFKIVYMSIHSKQSMLNDRVNIHQINIALQFKKAFIIESQTCMMVNILSTIVLTLSILKLKSLLSKLD